MKRYYLNSKLAKLFLFPSCHTITIGWFVFSKKSKLSEDTKVHETIHSLQWTEVTILSMLILSVMSFCISPLWILLSPLIYYILYVLEWLIRLPKGKAYRNISFEKEAYDNEKDVNYIYNRNLFSWIK